MIVCEKAPGDAQVGFTVCRPGEALPEVDAVVDAIRALPSSGPDRLVLTMCAAEPDGRISLAQQIADALDEEVRVQHGVLTRDPDGASHWTAVDANGRPSWRPFSQLCAYRPGAWGAAVERWNEPFPGAELVGPARYRLTADWVVEVVPAGLLVRPVTTAPNLILSSVATHPERVDLFVDGPAGTTLPDDVLCALGRVADAMPAAARSRLRLVLTPGIVQQSELPLRWAVPAPEVRWNPPDLAIEDELELEYELEFEDDVNPELEPASSVAAPVPAGRPVPVVETTGDPLVATLAEGLSLLAPVPVSTTELENYRVDPQIAGRRWTPPQPANR